MLSVHHNETSFILLGPTGVGKTTVGGILAQLLCCQFIDLDQHIETTYNLSISNIFAIGAEELFRQYEQVTLKEILTHTKERFVLSLGGGTVTNPTNYQLLASYKSKHNFQESSKNNNTHHALIVQLLADNQSLVNRLKNTNINTRPLFACSESQLKSNTNTTLNIQIDKLYQQRKHLYNSLSDINCNTVALTSERVAKKIISLSECFFDNANINRAQIAN